jgi:4-aminobutyrate aminotransferase/(S)-3-amino-2-methylpropionate transaminase
MADQKRNLVGTVPGPKSEALHRRRASAVAPGLSSALPVYIREASGAILVDVDGNSLVDLGAGIGVNSVGHAAPELVEAVTEQATRFVHTCFMVNPYEGYVAVCEALNELAPGSRAQRTVLFNSGAEAVENAVKVARHATGRPAIVALDHAYHGRTNLTMALTAKNMPYKDKFGPFAPEVYRVPTSYPFRDPDGMSGAAAAARAIELVERQVGWDNVAGLLVEPIQGEGGFVVPAPGFLPTLAAWCHDRGVLLVADEIQTGFCRTGDWFACEDEGVEPDLLATAKALAGGLPLAAVTGRVEVMDAVHPGGLGGTYGGNPVSCAAALATIDIMRRHDLAGAARRIGSTIARALTTLKEKYPAVGDVRGRGAMMAMEIVRPGTREPDAEATRRILGTCHAQGVVTLSCGTYGNVVRLLPPLIIEEDLLAEGLAVLQTAVGQAVGSAA